MPVPTPMVIRLYDNEDNFKEYTRSFVPWKLMKLAVTIAKNLNVENMGEKDVDALAAMVVEVFGNQFSIEDLNEGADMSEMIAVLNTIVSKAKGSNSNPTKPG